MIERCDRAHTRLAPTTRPHQVHRPTDAGPGCRIAHRL
ncbi:hypothetical protein PAI11_34200 [Patulibacter medicamentivorans]|uniref:Uncharacterized protein n=1 Tax=Patulibacter medicamentivorans TaxID=1097667 RepID=H0E9A3_9ACTN|nr:hypothetical protein PAI11_34200 [Patulibacter medicamentivorans]